MQSFVIPGWIWVNLAVLVVAAIIIGVKLATETTHRGPVPGNIRRAGH